ncbi:hypothetical protein SERLA73DRAFT_188096 [Serpula lacrymans var. lacrymans S7.3]|uniref:Uncharacterized protein n=1 Tax=Serpula lacrymans var. lacrymans (strain S7.3) TaxID=936435 RepID=F8QAQ8_SERL3|nr:hypothetical protein SERLA73DRAFT_188096 [Serpula lacrymans var. lacrymans S7.3]
MCRRIQEFHADVTVAPEKSAAKGGATTLRACNPLSSHAILHIPVYRAHRHLWRTLEDIA